MASQSSIMFIRIVYLEKADTKVENKREEIHNRRLKEAEALASRLMHMPVSYTHLDVYKRQDPISRWEGFILI